MSAKAIREASGKDLINRNLPAGTAAAKCQFAAVTEGVDWTELLLNNPWLKTQVKAHSFIQSVFCLTTGPKPLPKRFLHTVRSRASSFK
jgi:hypothetical protein